MCGKYLIVVMLATSFCGKYIYAIVILIWNFNSFCLGLDPCQILQMYVAYCLKTEMAIRWEVNNVSECHSTISKKMHTLPKKKLIVDRGNC